MLLLEIRERLATRFDLTKTENEYDTLPIIDGKPLSPEDFNNLSDAQKAKIEENVRFIQTHIELASVEIDKLNHALCVDVEKLMDDVTLSVVKSRLEKIRND